MEFLGEIHMEEEPMVLDDELPDAFDAWLERLTDDDWIALDRKYKEKQNI